MTIKSLPIKSLKLAIMVAMAGLFAFSRVTSQAEDKKQPQHTVAQVMQEAMKKGQWKKLAAGEATPEEAEKLVALFEDLQLNKPPHGDPQSWEEKTHAIVEAAQAAARNEKEARTLLKRAIDCRSCHQSHKD